MAAIALKLQEKAEAGKALWWNHELTVNGQTRCGIDPSKIPAYDQSEPSERIRWCLDCYPIDATGSLTPKVEVDLVECPHCHAKVSEAARCSHCGYPLVS